MRLTVLLFSLLLAGCAFAQPSINVPIHWDAPATGMPPVQYVVQLSVDGGPWTDCCTSETTSAMVTLEAGRTYQAHVAARDARGRQGLWSQPSASYFADPGAPGPCGIVIWPELATKE